MDKKYSWTYCVDKDTVISQDIITFSISGEELQYNLFISLHITTSQLLQNA